MAHGVAPVATGCVVAAPHEGFDDHTEPMALDIARRLKTGWVIARDFRKTSEQRWFDVNRPTQRFWSEGRRGKARVTEVAQKVYAEYQRRVDAAAGHTPLKLLIEIHGHARRVTVEGRRVKLQAIEAATRGFSEEELKALKARYQKLVAELPEEDRVPLYVEQLDPTYVYRGTEVRYYFGASGSKRAGSMSPERCERALHFECPQHVRFSKERRRKYSALFAQLFRPLVERYSVKPE
ncbi:MAG TPA: hypothetical protein DEA08_31930 [Planctomycetes bacterium]|nr:hypothetical protein [Planctomycetota bacterium]